MEIEAKHPQLVTRIKAVFADTFVVILLMMLATQLLSSYEITSKNSRIISMIIIISHEPILVSFIGGSIGHYLVRIRVKNQGNLRNNVSLSFAILRFLIKIFLDWISLLTVTNDKKKRAIHDIASNSVVIVKP